jgi:hypothetical protein
LSNTVVIDTSMTLGGYSHRIIQILSCIRR